MKKTITLMLSDEELIALYRIVLDDDCGSAMIFLKKRLEREVKASIFGEGHCKPWFEVFGQNPIPGELLK